MCLLFESVSIKARLPSKVVFRQRSSTFKGHLPFKVKKGRGIVYSLIAKTGYLHVNMALFILQRVAGGGGLLIQIPQLSLAGTWTELGRNRVKYQPSGAGGTRTLPAMLHRLQHLTACLIQNGRWGLEISQTLCYWTP